MTTESHEIIKKKILDIISENYSSNLFSALNREQLADKIFRGIAVNVTGKKVEDVPISNGFPKVKEIKSTDAPLASTSSKKPSKKQSTSNKKDKISKTEDVKNKIDNKVLKTIQKKISEKKEDTKLPPRIPSKPPSNSNNPRNKVNKKGLRNLKKVKGNKK